jgi:death-on-curing protein
VSVRYLSFEDLLALANDLGQLVVRDVGLLDSAAHRPQSTVFGEDAYESIHQKAAVLLESILTNHPLVDGNKRLGWLSVYAFYGLNGYTLDAPDDAAYDLVIAVASGDVAYRLAADALADWVIGNR